MPPKIALVIHSLAGGGAERVVSLLANHWVESGQDVTLITLDETGNDAYPLSQGVHRIGLGLMSESRTLSEGISRNVTRARRLRRAIQASQAPVAISFTEKMNIVTLAACWGLRTGVVVCERVDPRHHRIGRKWAWLRNRLYPRCRSLVVQTEAVRTWARDYVRSQPVYVIPNAAPAPQVVRERGNAAEKEDLHIVALGRLAHQKGFDLLIAAFSQVVKQFPHWRLQVYGEGTARPALEQLCTQLGLKDRVQFPGWVSSPDAVLRDADVFVLSSRYEGFPNALLEAMANGLACISFDCESGPRDIVRNEVDGILVPSGDVDALAQAMKRVMADATLRCRLGEMARQVTRRFSLGRFFQQWYAVVEGATEQDVDALAPTITTDD